MVCAWLTRLSLGELRWQHLATQELLARQHHRLELLDAAVGHQGEKEVAVSEHVRANVARAQGCIDAHRRTSIRTRASEAENCVETV